MDLDALQRLCDAVSPAALERRYWQDDLGDEDIAFIRACYRDVPELLAHLKDIETQLENCEDEYAHPSG